MGAILHGYGRVPRRGERSHFFPLFSGHLLQYQTKPTSAARTMAPARTARRRSRPPLAAWSEGFGGNCSSLTCSPCPSSGSSARNQSQHRDREKGERGQHQNQRPHSPAQTRFGGLHFFAFDFTEAFPSRTRGWPIATARCGCYLPNGPNGGKAKKPKTNPAMHPSAPPNIAPLSSTMHPNRAAVTFLALLFWRHSNHARPSLKAAP